MSYMLYNRHESHKRRIISWENIRVLLEVELLRNACKCVVDGEQSPEGTPSNFFVGDPIMYGS